MNVAGAIADMASSSNAIEVLAKRAGAIGGLAGEVAGLVDNALAVPEGVTYVAHLRDVAKASDGLIARAEAEFDEVSRGASLLGMTSAPVEGPIATVRGSMLVIPEGLTMPQQQALSSEILFSAAPRGERGPLGEAMFVRPGVPLESARMVGQPLGYIETPNVSFIGKRGRVEQVRALVDNYPVGVLTGHQSRDLAQEEAEQIVRDSGGTVLVRKLAGGSDGDRFVLHYNKDAPLKIAGKVRGSQLETVTPGSKDIVAIVTPAGTELAPSMKSTTAATTPASMERLEAIVSGGQAPTPVVVSDIAEEAIDPAIELTRNLRSAEGSIDEMRGARETLRKHRADAASIDEAIDRTPGTGDRYTWETKPLFGAGSKPLLATDLVASSSDPNVAIAALRSEPDGTYAVLVDAGGNFESFRVMASKAEILEGPAHSDMRALAKVQNGEISFVQKVTTDGRERVFGGTTPDINLMRLPNVANSTDLVNELRTIAELPEAHSIDEQIASAKAWLRAHEGPHSLVVSMHDESSRSVAAELMYRGKPSFPNTAYDGWKGIVLDPLEQEHGLTDTVIVFKKQGKDAQVFKPGAITSA